MATAQWLTGCAVCSSTLQALLLGPGHRLLVASSALEAVQLALVLGLQWSVQRIATETDGALPH